MTTNLDMRMEILRRIPFKSVLRCKLVSKEWKNGINDPRFINFYPKKKYTAVFLGNNCLYVAHGNNNNNDNSDDKGCLVIGQGNNDDDQSCLFIGHDYSDDDRSCAIGLSPPFRVHRIPINSTRNGKYSFYDPINFTRNNGKYSFYDHQLLNSGSTDSMACVKAANGHFLLHNLFTGSSTAVTDAPLQQHSSHLWLSYGFGYDRYANDYKIMVVCQYIGSEDNKFGMVQNTEKSLFWVYSFRGKGWKSFTGFPHAAYDDWSHSQQAHSLDGVLHWLLVTRGDRKGVIVTYDLHTGVFGETHVPNAYGSGWPSYLHHTGKLAELNGSLCYIYKRVLVMEDLCKAEHPCADLCKTVHPWADVHQYDVWVMNTLKHDEVTWEKLVSIDCSRLSQDMPWDWTTPALVHDQSGDILFVCHYKAILFWYDVNKRKIKGAEDEPTLEKTRRKQLKRKAMG